MNKDLYAFLAKTLNRDNDAVTSLFNEDGSLKENTISELTKWDAERIQRIKTNEDTGYQNGYKKGHREIATTIETKLKKAFNIETEATGDDLINELLENSATQSGAVSKLTDDDVKKHPLFIQSEKNFQKQLKEAKEAANQEIEKFKGEQTRKERFATVKEKALEKVLAKNPILPEDQAKAKIRLQRDVVDPLAQYDYEIGDDGNIVVLKDGKRVEDKHGNAVSFDDLVLDLASQSLDFKKHEDRRSPNGNNPPPPAGEKPKAQFVPKNQEEYQAYISRTDVEASEKLAVVKAWNAPKG